VITASEFKLLITCIQTADLSFCLLFWTDFQTFDFWA